MKIILLLSLVLISLSACYAPHTKKLTQPKPVSKPEYVLAGANQWNLENEVVYTGGALTLWAPTVQGHQFARLLKATEDFNRATVALYRYHDKNVNPLILKRDEKLQELKKLEEQRKTLFSEWQKSIIGDLLKTRQDQMEKVYNWFDDSIATTSNAYKAHVKRSFDKFCDAKIWEMATDENFATKNYRMRPTPLAVCEKSYVDRRVFALDANRDHCADAGDGQFKNYFKCFWIAAANTEFVTKVDENGVVSKQGIYAPERAQLMIGLLNDEKALIEKLKDQKYTDNIRNSIRLVTMQMKPAEFYEPFVAAVADKDKTFSLLTISRMIMAFENSEEFLNRAKRQLRMKEEDAKLLLESATLMPVKMDDGMGGLVDVPVEFLRIGENLSAQIKLLGERKFADGKININDIIFNDAIASEQRAAPLDFSTSGLTVVELQPITIPKNIGQLDEAVSDLQNAINSIELEYISAYEKGTLPIGRECDDTEKTKNASCARKAASVYKLKTVTEESPIAADVLFTRMNFVTKPFNGQLVVKIQLDDSEKNRLIGVGCLNLESGRQEECDKSLVLTSDERIVALRLDVVSQQIEVDIPLLEASRWGFVDNLKKEESVNRIPTTELLDKVLHLEIFPNTMYEMVPFISGTASLRSTSGEEIRMGTVAYLTDTSIEKKYILPKAFR